MKGWQWFYYGHWKKPLAVFLTIVAYIAFAGGIAVACLPVELALRIAMPIVGVAVYGLFGFFSAWLFDVYLSSSSLQRQREWRAMPKGERFIFIVTLPCKIVGMAIVILIFAILSFFAYM